MRGISFTPPQKKGCSVRFCDCVLGSAGRIEQAIAEQTEALSIPLCSLRLLLFVDFFLAGTPGAGFVLGVHKGAKMNGNTEDRTHEAFR